MAIIAEDDLSDVVSNDTDINGRTLTGGGTWQPKMNGSTQTINIVSATPDYFIGSSASATSTYKNSNLATAYNDEAIADIYWTTFTQSSNGVGLCMTGTEAGANKAWYTFYLAPAAPQDFVLNKLDQANAIDFSHTVSQATAGVTISATTTYEWKIRVVDNGDGTLTLKCFVDGVEVISWTDDGVTNGALLSYGAAGLRARSGGRQFNFLHQTWSAGGATIPIFAHHMKQQGMA